MVRRLPGIDAVYRLESQLEFIAIYGLAQTVHPADFRRLAAHGLFGWFVKVHAVTARRLRFTACNIRLVDQLVLVQVVLRKQSYADAAVNVEDMLILDMRHATHVLQDLVSRASGAVLIDLRDHRDFTRPLDFLCMTPDEYAEIATENRLRASDWQRLFDEAGFETLERRYTTVPKDCERPTSAD